MKLTTPEKITAVLVCTLAALSVASVASVIHVIKSIVAR